MLLAIDIGNTNTVIGVFDPNAGPPSDAARARGEIGGLAHHWRVATKTEWTPDEFALLLVEVLALGGLELARRDRPAPARGVGTVSGLAVSSSAPGLVGVVREMAARYLDAPLVVVEPGIRTGMPIRYENPREVGADRIVNAVAALDLYGPPAIVVDLGTATTFDVISPSGEYLGGAIVPGVEISMAALVGRAAALRNVALVAPRQVVGRTTVESMQAGAVYGAAALVEGLCRRIEEEVGPAKVIATGGLGAIVVPHTKGISHYEPWLTLHGLRLLYDKNVEDVREADGA